MEEAYPLGWAFFIFIPSPSTFLPPALVSPTTFVLSPIADTRPARGLFLSSALVAIDGPSLDPGSQSANNGCN